MATQGGWMTPTILGRWVFEKPPLLVWLSAISMKLFGIGPYTARIPALLAGALIATLCFAIARAARSILAGILAAALCIADQLLFTMSRHNMTDILLTACGVVVLAILVYDPPLSLRSSRIAFTIAIAAGILTKSIAGLLPAFAALLFAALSKSGRANRLRVTAVLTGIAILLASPWFLYNLIVHGNWFRADMGFQLVTVGMKPHQISSENNFVFYLLRLIYAAPAAVVLSITGIAALIPALRRRESVPVLLGCYLAVSFAALLIFRFRSEQYLTSLIPALILIAVISSPFVNRRFGVPLLVAIGLLFFVKADNPAEPWGISYEAGSTVAAARALSHYCEAGRGNDLYIIGADDEFYALALPLAHLRYGWIDPQNLASNAHPYLEYLGILQPVSAPLNAAVYESRLRAWGLNSPAPLATGIVGQNIADFAGLILAHPESDFLVSSDIAHLVRGRDTHVIAWMEPAFVLLESKTSLPAAPRRWTCRM